MLFSCLFCLPGRGSVYTVVLNFDLLNIAFVCLYVLINHKYIQKLKIKGLSCNIGLY